LSSWLPLPLEINVNSKAAKLIILGWGGISQPSDSTFKSVYGSGAVYGGEFRLRTFGNVYLSIRGGYYKKRGKLTVTQEETTMTILPIDAIILFPIAAKRKISPYLGAGGSLCNYKESNFLGTVKNGDTATFYALV
jgi:hypothetical protein